MTRARLILNGKGAADPEVRAAVERVRKAGQTLEVRATWEAGDAERYAGEAVEDGVDLIVAGGGDGTLHEVVNGVVTAGDEAASAVAVLPLGTANDFATGCGIPAGCGAALDLALRGEARPIDLGRVQGRCFVNLASGGFGAEVTAETPDNLKTVAGGGAYALVGLVTAAAKLAPCGGSIELPDTTVEGPFLVMAVGNGRLAGGGFTVTPEALLDDGLLDLVYVHDFPATRLAAVVGELRDPANPGNEVVRYHQVPRCEVVLDRELAVSLDGEPQSWDRMEFEVAPGRLRMVLPEECPLLRG
ncbi:MAG: lipid kinase YegS [Thermoanaerobaculia bacterium]|nr:lipid kinase YegS [Thermoanaerobaculia bacterium]